MLNQNQEKYLLKIPEDKIFVLKPYDSKSVNVVENIKRLLSTAGVNLKVIWMGSLALGISGQGDIDLYILCDSVEFDKYVPIIEKVFGPRVYGISIYKWNLEIDGFEVEMYLTDPTTPSMIEQIHVFKKLKSDKNLLNEYELVKQSSNGLLFRDYMRKKYEFFNQLEIDSWE